MEKTDLKSLSFEELTAFFTALGEPAFRAGQVFTWLHRGAESFDEMTNLSLALRKKLSEQALVTVSRIERKLVSKIDGPIKSLFRLADGQCIEPVLMSYRHGDSICLSTQAGAPSAADPVDFAARAKR